MSKKDKPIFRIIREKDGKLYYRIKEDTIDTIDALLDINVTLFLECILNNVSSTENKFKVLDSFMKRMRQDIEQGIVYNS